MEAKEVLAWEFGSQVIQRPFDFLINHPKQVKKKRVVHFLFTFSFFPFRSREPSKKIARSRKFIMTHDHFLQTEVLQMLAWPWKAMERRTKLLLMAFFWVAQKPEIHFPHQKVGYPTNGKGNRSSQIPFE